MGAALVVWEFASQFSEHQYSPEDEYQASPPTNQHVGHILDLFFFKNHTEDQLGDGDEDHKVEGAFKRNLNHKEEKDKTDKGHLKQEKLIKEGEHKEEEKHTKKRGQEAESQFKEEVKVVDKEEIEVVEEEEEETEYVEESHGHGLMTTALFIPVFILFLLGGDYVIQRSRRINYDELSSAEPQIDSLATLSEWRAI